jgi:hypothetical protein
MLIVCSCSNNNSVVTGGLIQKRKYNKGFFVKTKSKANNKKSVINLNEDKHALINQTDLKEIQKEDFNYVESDYNTDNNIVALNVVDEDSKKSLNLIVDENIVSQNPLLVALLNRQELKRSKKNIALYRFNKDEVIDTNQRYYEKNETLAMIGSGFGVWGFLIAFGSPLVGTITCFTFGGIALVLAFLSFRKRKKNPKLYKTKTWVWVAILTGILCFIKAFVLMSQI